jgi:hypothetical protein
MNVTGVATSVGGSGGNAEIRLEIPFGMETARLNKQVSRGKADLGGMAVL